MATCCVRRPGPRRSTSPSAGSAALDGITRDDSPAEDGPGEVGTLSQGVGVLTGGRLTHRGRVRATASSPARCSARTTSTSAPGRTPRRRPSSWPARLPVAASRPGPDAVTYADLETASGVLLVAFEAEDEAGAIFLRLRKAHRKSGLKSWTLAPYLGNGARKHGATLIPTVPGDEAATLDRIGTGRPRRRRDHPGRRAGGDRAGHADRGAPAVGADRAPGSPGCRAGPATAVRSRRAACRTCCPAAVRWPTPRRGSTPRPPGGRRAARIRRPRRRRDAGGRGTASWPR